MPLKCQNFPNLKTHYFGISITILMIMQHIEVSSATNIANILPMAIPMNNASLMNVPYHQPAMALASLPNQNKDQTIERSKKRLWEYNEDEDGVDHLAKKLCVPREHSQKHLEQLREEEGKEYPDSPFAKFADMKMPEKMNKNHKDQLMNQHDKHLDLDDGENAVDELEAHNGLETIDKNAVENARDGHGIAGTTSHADAPIRIREKDPRRVKIEPLANQGDADRRIKFSFLKRRVSSILKRKKSNKRRRTLFGLFGL